MSGLNATAEVIDASVRPTTFAQHLRDGVPFAYLRDGDGEWLSILGEHGSNCDRHDFFPDTLGKQLQASLAYASRLCPENEHLYMGLHAGLFQPAIRRYLVENNLAYRLHWVSDNLFAQGLFDRSTLQFIEAVKAHAPPKVLLGNAALAPVAAGLGLQHIVIPRTNCFLQIDRIHDDCQRSRASLLIFCAGMASECLIHRLHEQQPDCTYVDCGHVFDAFVGIHSRDYTQVNGNGILEFLAEHYVPVVLGTSTRQGQSA